MNCSCKTTHEFSSVQRFADLASIDSYDEVWVFKCSPCGSLWLRVLFEAAHYSKSGHWYDALISQNEDLKLIVNKSAVENLFLNAQLCFQGGSFFDGKVTPFEGIPRRLV